jgi:hypothetical protein
MECLLLLEYYINNKWYTGSYDELIGMLPAHQFAIRSPTISSVALRIYCLDMCLDYKKIQLPTRPKRSDERRTSYASLLAPEKKETSTVFTSSGRKSKTIVSYSEEYDEDKVAKKQKKQKVSRVEKFSPTKTKVSQVQKMKKAEQLPLIAMGFRSIKISAKHKMRRKMMMKMMMLSIQIHYQCHLQMK